MKLKVFVTCFFLFGFCQDVYCQTILPEDFLTTTQKQNLEILKDATKQRIDKNKILYAVPISAINPSNRAKYSKGRPHISLRVLKPKNHKPIAVTTETPPSVNNLNEISGDPPNDNKKVNNDEVKEDKPNETPIYYIKNKPIDRNNLVMHENETGNFKDTEKTNGELPNKETSESSHKQMYARSLNRNTNNFFEEDNPPEYKETDRISPPIENSLRDLKKTGDENKSVENKVNKTSLDYEDNSLKRDGQSLETKENGNTQDRVVAHDEMLKKTINDSIYKNKLFVENNTNSDAIPMKTENDINGYQRTQQVDEKFSLPPTTNFHTHLQPSQHPAQNHYHQPWAFGDQPNSQYGKYYLYPMYNEAPSYGNYGFYSNQAGTQKYHYVPMYDYQKHTYGVQENPYNPIPNYSTQAIQYPQYYQSYNSGSAKDIYGNPAYHYSSHNQPSMATYYPQYAKTFDSGVTDRNTMNYYNTNPTAQYDDSANSYQNYFSDFPPIPDHLDPLRPDVSLSPPPYQYPFEEVLEDYHLKDGFGADLTAVLQPELISYDLPFREVLNDKSLNNYNNLNSYLFLQNFERNLGRYSRWNYFDWLKNQRIIKPNSYNRPNLTIYGFKYFPTRRNSRSPYNGGNYIIPYQIGSNSVQYSLWKKNNIAPRIPSSILQNYQSYYRKQNKP